LRHLRIQAAARLEASVARRARHVFAAGGHGNRNLEALLDVALFGATIPVATTEYGRTYLARTNRLFAEMDKALPHRLSTRWWWTTNR
jgi:DNA-binding transcriptional LysR family regulator